MRKLIIINQTQFGYHTTSYYHCKYLKNFFDLVYISWDHGLPKIVMDDINVLYVSRNGNTLVRNMRFLQQTIKQINSKQAIVFIKYFKWVSLLLRLLKPGNCFVLDIRTGSVSKNPTLRRFKNTQLKFETWFFKHVTVISHSLAARLGISHKAHILPLGADIISTTNKSFEGLHLLYVGTLFNRNMDVTIHGFKNFYHEIKGQIPISYTIIGSGLSNEEQALKRLVDQYSLQEVINITGIIPHTQIKPWFDAANIGVSYVPMTGYYDCQPVTKTFEYLLSGMPVIATKTSENKKVINHQNGVTIGDSAEDFYRGLKRIFENKSVFESHAIRESSMKHTWSYIVNSNLKPYLQQLDN